jgi:CubicO group peptidase (beta-lactamase class C family)
MRMIRFNSEPFTWRNAWRSPVRPAVAVILAVGFSAPSTAQQLTPTERTQIDRDVLAVLEATTAPSASIAIVRGGEIVYERAYGDGRIDPKTPAAPSMRYAIGSVSKQFTATAILLLQEEGKLSLQDKVATWFPQLTDTILADGNAAGYGLGVSISAPGGRRRISHGGAVSGYTTSNRIYPDDRSAIVVFTNIYPGAAGAPERIADRIANPIFASATTASADARESARRLYDALTKGTIDRSVFTPAANAYFTQEVLADYAASLAPLGSPTEFVATGESLRGGMTIRSYRIRAGGALMDLTTMTLPDGRIDQYIISRAG